MKKLLLIFCAFVFYTANNCMEKETGLSENIINKLTDFKNEDLRPTDKLLKLMENKPSADTIRFDRSELSLGLNYLLHNLSNNSAPER